MNKLIFALIAILAIAHAQNYICTKSDKYKDRKCSSQVEPVCAIRQSNLQGSQPLRKNFNSRCEACKDSSVLFVAQGFCEMYPENGTFCHPDSVKNQICTEEYNPVCGMMGTIFTLCRGGPCVQTYSNGCQACSSGSFFHIPGKCGQDATE